jgi:hypothetical protein
MPRDSAHAPQFPLFVHDPAASPQALARYEAIRPVLKGERCNPAQNIQVLLSRLPRSGMGVSSKFPLRLWLAKPPLFRGATTLPRLRHHTHDHGVLDTGGSLHRLRRD